MTATVDDAVRDFDFHPREPHVRAFSIPRSGVLGLDDHVFVAETRHGEIVLRHYAFADEWFKVNVTTDSDGVIVETPAGPDHPAFAFNCDIATPMRRDGDTVFSVDLFTDVLVRGDGTTFHVKDEPELTQAVTSGLVSRHEFVSAHQGLEQLVGLIERGLIAFLEAVIPFGPSTAPDALPATQVPLANVPEVRLERRWSWHAPIGASRLA